MEDVQFTINFNLSRSSVENYFSLLLIARFRDQIYRIKYFAGNCGKTCAPIIGYKFRGFWVWKGWNDDLKLNPAKFFIQGAKRSNRFLCSCKLLDDIYFLYKLKTLPEKIKDEKEAGLKGSITGR